MYVLIIITMMRVDVTWAKRDATKKCNARGALQQHDTDATKFLDSLHDDILLQGMQGWNVSTEDRTNMQAVLERMNAHDENGEPSSKWEWNVTEENKQYKVPWNILKYYEEHERHGLLALHLIHTHGMGPFLAAKQSSTWKQQVCSEDGGDVSASANRRQWSRNTVVAFARSVEQHGSVQEIHQIMRRMSKEGLLHVHAFDHTFTGGSGSTDRGDSPQCTKSTTTFELMTACGFGTVIRSQIKDPPPEDLIHEFRGNNINSWAYEEHGFYKDMLWEHR